MSSFRHLESQNRKRWGLTFALLFLSLALEPADSEGQSGRHTTKPESPASSTPTPVAKDDSNGKDIEKPLAPGQLPTKVRLLAARQPTSRHLVSEDQIFAAFVKQLNRYENIEAVSIGDLKEGRAVERAKAETEAFVVLLRFDVDSFQGGTIILNSQDLEIEYSVLAPRTGKRQTKGEVYFQAIGGGRLRKSDWPNGTPIRITPEATGIEAADGLYFWLKLAAARSKE